MSTIIAITKFDCGKEYKIAANNCESCFYDSYDEQNSHPALVYTTDNREKANENAMNALQRIINNTRTGERDRVIAEEALKVCKKSCFKDGEPKSQGIVEILKQNKINSS